MFSACSSIFPPSLPLFSSIFQPQTDKIAHPISPPVRPHILFSKVVGTYRSLSVSVRVLCCRRWTMKTVTATPMMSPMATTPPRIPITPPGGPCGIGFSADKRRNNSVRMGSLWVIDAAGMEPRSSRRTAERFSSAADEILASVRRQQDPAG